MSSSELVSIVITTYNRSDALLCVLDALRNQTDPQFEVVVADDGSSEIHQQAIMQAVHRFPFMVKHVWHPDIGFTAAQVRNLGVASAEGAYLILLDGDCVPDVDFVARHRALSEVGSFVNGSRVLLSPDFTRRVVNSPVRLSAQPWAFWLKNRVMGRVSKLTGQIRLPDFVGRKQPAFVWKGIRSCNLSLWRADYIAVNGFDETFVGWGHEDADFVLRLHNAGLVRKNGFCATEVYHLWHRESSRDKEGVNAAIVRERMASGQIRATIGYEESLSSQDVRVRRWG